VKKFSFVLAGMLVAYNAVAAETPKVRLEGRMDTQAGTVKQSNGFRTDNPSNPSAGTRLNDKAIVNDTYIDIHADGKVNNDMTYGGMIRMHADASVATNSEQHIGDKALVYIQHNKIGRIEAGNTPGAGGLFEMDTVNFNTGSWGVDGFWSQWVTARTSRTTGIFFATGAFGSLNSALGGGTRGNPESRGFEFIVSPNLLSNYSGHYYSDAPKVNLFTKPIKELTLGVAFIPDLDSSGTVANIAPKKAGPQDDRAGNPPSYRNIISGGFVYEKKFNDTWGIKTGVTGEIGKAKVSYMRDLKAYEAGLMVSYKEFRIGGTVGSWFKSLSLKEKLPGTKQGSQYYTLGAAHSIDKLGYAVTYMSSKKAGGVEMLGKQVFDDAGGAMVAGAAGVTQADFSDTKYNKFQNLVFDVDYKLAPGFMPYATFSKFKFKESKGAKDDGHVGLVGVRMTF
jgi:hypothetical protein